MITIRRYDGPDPFKTGSPPMPPLTWQKYGPWHSQFAIVCCSHGHVCALSSKIHTVAADGTLSPSLVCPMDCTWHVFVRLDGWCPPSVE